MPEIVADKQTWGFPQGHEIAPGRTTLKLLGGGNRYEVYRVWDELHSSVMVAKVLRPDLVEEEYALRGLRREIDALEALAHPVLLRSIASHIEGPYPHLLVEHLDGPTLRRLIRKDGALPAEQALPLGLHVASAIHYMAEEGWVHLDVKPDNLVMGSSPRLIDLSLARTIERARRLTGYIGTNAYMSPEQCNPRLDVGPPADVWGLGATLYHAVAGRPPFRRPRTRDAGAALEDRYPQLEDEPYEWRRPVPQALSDAILACLRKDPAERPSAGELALMLQPVSAPGRGRPLALPRPAWHSQRR
ncbi:MAG TPA: serine/threonine-protein kinase [Thermoleophilaceae bacterium]|nr:serine/threonine-protein kinase [Thermoleophilaceae bacterium]